MAMMSTHHSLMISASGWASTVAGRSSSALKLISQMPSNASGFESSLSRVKCRKQWVSQGVRWETLGLASSPVAFVSCWTKQCHSERAEGPCEISTQEAASVLLALPARVRTSTSLWVVPQQALRDAAWMLTIPSWCSVYFFTRPSTPIAATGLGLPLQWPEMCVQPTLWWGDSLSPVTCCSGCAVLSVPCASRLSCSG